MLKSASILGILSVLGKQALKGAIDYSDEEAVMSKVCEICKKGPTRGNNVSHANNRTKRTWYPNLQKVRTLRDGRITRMRVCTRCIRSGFVTKAP